MEEKGRRHFIHKMEFTADEEKKEMGGNRVFLTRIANGYPF